MSVQNYARAARQRKRLFGVVFVLVNLAAMAASRLPIFEPYQAGVYGLGVFCGLAAGLVMVGIVERRDRSFRTEDDVVSELNLPVLAMVPAMFTVQEHRSRQRFQRGLTAGLLLTVGGAVIAWAVLR